MSLNDRSWDKLLDNIHDGGVVPIIGSRLLVAADGKSSLLAAIAQTLLENNDGPEDASLTPFREVHDAAFLLRDKLKGLDLYEEVQAAYDDVLHPKDASKTPTTPEPLRQLAQISDFRLFVTLTPDDFLLNCLQKRCATQEVVHSPKWPTSEWKDLPTDWRNTPGTAYLLYLFGKLRSSPTYAVHDEDILEYAHNIIARGSQVPTTFLGELQQHNLLLIGSTFPEWVTRFFLRACNQRRLAESEQRSWLIEDLKPEDNLTVFLNNYSSVSQILSQSSPVEFVNELYTRWKDKYGGMQVAPAATPQQQPPKSMFFISYSRCNVVQAQAMYDTLKSLGVSDGDIWFDKQAIEPGQDYQRRILDGIDGCIYFLPLLSLDAVSREEGFVFKEWLKASERLEKMNRDFVVPVVVDTEYHPEQYRQRSVLNWSDNRIDFGFAPNGVPNDHLTTRLQSLLSAARNSGGMA
jgi:TIR domain